MEISGVYKITNTVTGDFYIGSSKDIKERWSCHKRSSTWKKQQNNQLYKDMQNYGLENFEFEIIEEVEIDKLKEKEQQFIEMLQPSYNSYYADGRDVEKIKECQRKYRESEKGKKYRKKYEKTDKRKEYRKKYDNQLCFFNGEKLTLCALSARFRKAGIEHPRIEAKKYLIQ